MRDRYDLDGLTDDQILRNGTIHLFPNLLGPIVHGNATLYRARPNGLDPDSTLLDYWALEWVPQGSEAPPIERKFYEDWATKDWGQINNQDFGNLVEITAGHEVAWLPAGPPQPGRRKPTSSTTTRSLTGTSPS